MEPDEIAPAGVEPGGLLVGGRDAVEARAAEEGQHREVGESVSAVGGRVDEDGAVGGEDDVARPQVAVDARRRSVVVEVPGSQTLADPVDGAGPASSRCPRSSARRTNGRTRCSA